MRELDTYINEALIGRRSPMITQADTTGDLIQGVIGKWLQGSNFRIAGHKADADSDQFNILIDLVKGLPRMIIDDVSPLESLPSQWRVVLEPSGALKARGKENISMLFIRTPLDAGDTRRLNGLLSLMSTPNLLIGNSASINGVLSLQMVPSEIGEIFIDLDPRFLKGVRSKVLDLRVREDSMSDLGNIAIDMSGMPLSQAMDTIKKGYITIEGLPKAPSESITIQTEDINIDKNIGRLLRRIKGGMLDKCIWEISSKDTPRDISDLGQIFDHVLWDGPKYDLSQHLSIIQIIDSMGENHYTVEIINSNKRRKRTKAMPYTICIHSQIRPEITYRISKM